MKKRLFALLLAVGMILCLAACGGGSNAASSASAAKDSSPECSCSHRSGSGDPRKGGFRSRARGICSGARGSRGARYRSAPVRRQ